MEMTEGQRLALEQFQEIQAASGGLIETLHVKEAVFNPQWVEVSFSLFCGDKEKAEDGLPLKTRERLIMFIPPDFPFARPHIWTLHTRFAEFPHVQWKRYLCLYQSPSTEWDPSDGMFGFIQRLNLWLQKGALGELDPTGEPLHPPVAYLSTGPIRTVIPRVDTPSVSEENWYGSAHLRVVTDYRVDVSGWSPLLAEDTPRGVAAAILLSEPMPYEFPATVNELLSELIRRGVPIRMLILTLQAAVLSNDEGEPLYVIVGTAMRGIRGSGELKQHLTAWYLSPTLAQALRLAVNSYKEDERFREIGQRAEQIFLDWAKEAKVEWCVVREDRPEIVIRRDQGSPISWFDGRIVSMWGCGALGGHVAEFLARARVRKLVLRDKALVGPGLLARQPYDDLDIGRPKVEALRDRLKRIRPDLEIETHSESLLVDPLASADWTDGADVVIDTTGSEAVLGKLELKRHLGGGPRVPVISMVVGHRAESGVIVLAGPEYSGGPLDVSRRAKLEACNRSGLETFANEFWPARDAPRRKIFQPEPGCSDSTYIGSDADAAALAGLMLNRVAVDLMRVDGTTASAHFFIQPHAIRSREENLHASFFWQPDRVSLDPHAGYEIRVAESAWSDMLAWVEQSSRQVGPEIETGGLLFGERDDAARVLWVSEVSGPPPDSEASEAGFICGVVGTAEANAEKKRRSRESVQYLGMWHSHPGSSPIFSATDLRAMERLVAATSLSPSKSLLFIIGTPSTVPTIGTYVFSRADFVSLRSGRLIRECIISSAPMKPKPRRIGLALSGGGSRAIAFHLGCLRALHDRGLLSQVNVVSAVSGGAVIAAMYAYGDEKFEDFDARVVELLRRGLLSRLLRRALFSPRLLAALSINIIGGSAALAADITRMTLSIGSNLSDANGGMRAEPRNRMRSPIHRSISRTTAFEDVLRNELFPGLMLTAPRRDGIEVVLNACELRTGSAFRFGSRESGCWRFGHLASNNVPVALAVAASAAYPVFLPAIDRYFTFTARSGREFRERVILTDGGVFDNLGATCFEPGRSPEYSYNTFCSEYIVCCDAGQGLLDEQVYPFYWPSRMKRSFESVYRKANDSMRQRFYSYAASGAIKGFVLSYLGQMDAKLPYIPPDLIRRDEVYNYPTNFSPMKDRDIERLAARGEQLTRLLITRYCPEL